MWLDEQLKEFQAGLVEKVKEEQSWENIQIEK